MAQPSPVGKIIAREIAERGPIPFSRFMDLALYHPEFGYYRCNRRDPFGKEGDFYTAEQLQPVFGRLVASALRQLAKGMGNPPEFEVIELGAGRSEMNKALRDFRYTPVDIDFGALPQSVVGVFFSNEFFDALPVDLIIGRNNRWFERRVSMKQDRFIWDDTVESENTASESVRVRELQHRRLEWLERIARHLVRGFVLTIDYGYTDRELIRFPEGTLMSYHRHQAIEDVLVRPRDQDITAHVDFTALEAHGQALGLETVRYESLASFLLRTGEPDSFASALEAGSEAEQMRLRMQLKSLLFGMGETFRVLLQKK